MAAAASLALDAVSLNEELESMLLERCEGLCSASGNRLLRMLIPEVRALLRGVLWYLSTATEATSGEALLGLHRVAGAATASSNLERGTAIEPALSRTRPASERVPRLRSLLHGALVVLLPWAWARLSQVATDGIRPERLRWARWMRRAEGCAAIASVLVTLHFVRTGRSPTLPMALLGMQLHYVSERASVRQPAFDFMEQLLVFRTIADAAVAARGLAHAAPRTVPTSRVEPAHERPWLLNALRRQLGWELLSEGGGDADAHALVSDTDGCVFCAADPPHTPQKAPCSHSCCYFCIASALMTDSRAVCPRCGQRLKEAT